MKPHKPQHSFRNCAKTPVAQNVPMKNIDSHPFVRILSGKSLDIVQSARGDWTRLDTIGHTVFSPALIPVHPRFKTSDSIHLRSLCFLMFKKSACNSVSRGSRIHTRSGHTKTQSLLSAPFILPPCTFILTDLVSTSRCLGSASRAQSTFKLHALKLLRHVRPQKSNFASPQNLGARVQYGKTLSRNVSPLSRRHPASVSSLVPPSDCCNPSAYRFVPPSHTPHFRQCFRDKSKASQWACQNKIWRYSPWVISRNDTQSRSDTWLNFNRRG